MSRDEFKLNAKNLNFGRNALIVGLVGLISLVAGFFLTPRDNFFFAYLVGYVFWLSIALGGLFFTMLHHITGAEWSVVLRRIAESLAMTIPLMGILFIPIAFGIHDLYHWSHAEQVAKDELLQHKSGWLNITFFLIRAIVYFGLWSYLALTLNRHSLKQDAGDETVLRKMRKLSAPGIIFFALSITFAAFDFLMSLDPHWYSTIFGVYFFAGSWWLTLAFLNLFSQYLRKNSALGKAMTTEHYHDIGKLMFGFTVFWAYIAFSQFMLIWYGNIPEETIFYKHRWEYGWEYVSMLLFFGHFVLPFFILIFRSSKRNLYVMAIMGFWFVFMQWVDYYWLIMPNVTIANPDAHHGLHFSWLHLSSTAGIGGLFLWFFWYRLTSNPIVPIRDPKLENSMQFVNH
ncbi:MAG: hypothetical protein SFU91_01690 [Chloroherpetonaceae bacterium]|nr:hypothetical protein [Chloroherpetonaceae bacterium]